MNRYTRMQLVFNGSFPHQNTVRFGLRIRDVASLYAIADIS